MLFSFDIPIYIMQIYHRNKPSLIYIKFFAFLFNLIHIAKILFNPSGSMPQTKIKIKNQKSSFATIFIR